MEYQRKIVTYKRNSSLYKLIFYCLLLVGITCWVGIGITTAQDQASGALDSGPNIAITDASVKMDISDMGEISLGTIPDERLIITITVQNTGNREAPGYKLRSYLVRAGREDEVGAQIGGDITDTRLGAGETRTYTKSWSLPEHLKKGEYRVMVVLDSSNYFIEPDNANNRFIGLQSIVPGALTGPEGSIPVYSAAEITEPGHYVLKRDIDGGKKINIFEIKCSGVTFDGGGNTIRGISSGFTTGIYIDAGSAVRDITIKNLIVEDVDAGIWMYKASNGKIEGCTFRNIQNMGLRLDQSHQNEIYNNIFEQNSMGIGVFESKDNTIFNNLFKNVHNVAVNENLKNKWNTNLTSGTNIIGGSMVGGNAWYDESGEGGFSATAQDNSHDGISDNPYSINSNNIDLYPLSSASTGKQSPMVTPEAVEIPPEIDNLSSDDNSTGESDIPVITPEPIIEKVTLVTDEPEINQTETIQVDKPSVNETSDEVKNPVTLLSPYADISVKEVTGPESGCPGTEFTLSGVIENTGGYDADSFQVQYYLSEDKLIDAKDVFLGEKTIKNLQSGTEQTIKESFIIPKLIGYKNYYLVIVTNTDNSVYEDKKGNNSGYSSGRMTIRECQ